MPVFKISDVSVFEEKILPPALVISGANGTGSDPLPTMANLEGGKHIGKLIVGHLYDLKGKIDGKTPFIWGGMKCINASDKPVFEKHRFN